jgi:mRNA interferase RelE/StbE
LTLGPRRIRLGRRADRELRRLDPPMQRRVVAALDRLAADDRSLDVIKLTGQEMWRVRVGDWRILFDRDDAAHEIRVARIVPRGRAYDR